MAGRLQDKVAIITGAGHGIGRAYARRVAEEGAQVVIAELDAPAGERVAAEIGAAGGAAWACPTDVTDLESVTRLMAQTQARYGRVDVLLNNAAIYVTQDLWKGPAEDLPLEQWDRVLEVNLKGVYLCCRAVIPIMKAQRSGKIINVASGTFFTGLGDMPHYTAAKGGVVALTRGVVGHVAQASEEGARGDVDDLAAALGLHDRDDGPTAEVDALQVDLEHAVPLLERQVLGGPLPEVLRDADRRVVEPDVDAAVARLRLGHQARHALQIGHVGRAGPGGAAGRADLGRHALAGRRVQLGDDHLGAFLRDPPRIGPADPVAGAGDDRHLVLQPRAHAPLPRTTCYPQPYSLFRARC